MKLLRIGSQWHLIGKRAGKGLLEQKNYYQILGVSPRASAREIKAAYRKLAHRSHPDSGGDQASQALFQEITDAYKVLASKESRARYDLEFHAGTNRYQRATTEGPSRDTASQSTVPPRFSEWREMTKNAAEAVSSHRFSQGAAQDVQTYVDQWILGLREKFGRLKEQTVKRGQGTKSSEPEMPEAVLRGEREFVFTVDALESLHETSRELALEGKTGPLMIRVRIPAGVQDGDTLRVTNPETRGLLFVRIRVTPHALVEREGADIIIHLPITIREAVQGLELDVPTVGGSTRVKLPPQTGERNPQKRFRLKGRGLARRNEAGNGDLYVIPQIIAPESTSAGLEEALKSIDAHYLAEVRRNIPKRL